MKRRPPPEPPPLPPSLPAHIPLGPAAVTETHLGLLENCAACRAYAEAHPGTPVPARSERERVGTTWGPRL